jgi:hypothetical protein
VNFYDRFELLGLHRDDGIKTFQAREVSTGRLVQVHLFVHPDAPESVALLKKLDILPEEERQRIVDRGENQGTPYVVTDRLMDQPGFREWLVAKTKKPVPEAPPQLEKKPLEAAGAWKIVTAPPPSAKSSPEPAKTPPETIDEQFASLFATGERPTLPPDPAPPAVAETTRRIPETTLKMPAARPPVAAPAGDPGEFTQLFHSGTIAQPEKRDPPPPQPQPQAPPQPQTHLQPQAQAGEFTRMFQAPVTPQAPAQQAPPQQARPQAGPPSPQPGEFTRMFQTPAHPTEQPVAAPTSLSASKSKDGEFTRFFETPMAQGPLPQSPAVQQPLAPKVPGSSGPNRVGEFTQMFGRGSMPAAPPPTPSAPPPAGGATSAFAVERPAAPSPAPLIPKGPSEYTQMFARPAPLTFGQPSPQQQQPAQPKPQAAPKSYLPLILGLAAVVLLAVVIVVIFALRR